MSEVPVIERFQSKVFKTSRCWLWTGALTSMKPFKGYGIFWNKGKKRLAHRFSYERAIGPIPDGLDIDHLCRVRCCVNPEHLEPVTRLENILRGEGLNRPPATKCRKGHKYTDASTYVYPDGRRACRICRRAAEIARGVIKDTRKEASSE